jgi:hypothetical protein
MTVKECAMIAGLASGIEGVSARYAAQIQELLYVQTIRRMVADQEAARAQARADEAHRREDERAQVAESEAVKVDVDAKAAAASASEDKPVKQPDAKEAKPAAPAPVLPAQIFDVKA